MNKLIRVLCLLFLWIFLAASCKNKNKVDFFQLDLENLQGAAVSQDSFKGKPMFVTFFATWCGPCMQEIPSIRKASEALGSHNMEFVLISEEKLEKLQRFESRTPMDVTILHSARNIKMLGVFTIPQTYLVSADGEVVYSHTGFKDWSSPESIALLKSIAGNPVGSIE